MLSSTNAYANYYHILFTHNVTCNVYNSTPLTFYCKNVKLDNARILLCELVANNFSWPSFFQIDFIYWTKNSNIWTISRYNSIYWRQQIKINEFEWELNFHCYCVCIQIVLILDIYDFVVKYIFISTEILINYN